MGRHLALTTRGCEGKSPLVMSGESRRGRSIVSGIFVLFVTVFILSTTWQLGRGVFSGKAKSAHPPPAACVAGISRLASALDRALAAAASISDEGTALATFSSGALPEWNDREKVAAECSVAPEGQDAFSALLRLRHAQEGFLQRQVAEVSPMRRDVEAYLR